MNSGSGASALDQIGRNVREFNDRQRSEYLAGAFIDMFSPQGTVSGTPTASNTPLQNRRTNQRQPAPAQEDQVASQFLGV